MVLIPPRGFIATQVLGAIFFIGEGGRALRPGAASHLGQHIADVVTMIEETEPLERASMLVQFGSSGFRVGLMPNAPVGAEAASDHDPTASIADEVARHLHGTRVVASATPDKRGPPGHGVVAVQLAEGGPMECSVRRTPLTGCRQGSRALSRIVRGCLQPSRLKTPITRPRLRTEMLDDSELKNRFARDQEEMEQMVSATSDLQNGFGTAQPREAVDMVALLESRG